MTAFALTCFLGLQAERAVYFRNVNDCLYFKELLHNQEIKVGKEPKSYQCVCKVIAQIDSNKFVIH